MLPLDTDPPEERRAEPRRICHHHCLVRFDRQYLDGQPGSVGAPGFLSDISPSGVGLHLRPGIPSGATLVIESLGSSALPLPPAQVVHCVPVDGRWRHGCRLQRRLTEEELRDLLAVVP
jgi:hypothetical protein